MFRGVVLAGMVALLALVFTPAARGDGLPIPTDYSTPDGVASADGAFRYVTLPAGNGTLVERVERSGGRVVASRFLHGDFTIPLVAINGTAGGLSHDGATLTLIKPRVGFPRKTTPMLFLDTRHLSVRGRVTLPGDFSFDAISPDGRAAYLVHYLSHFDPTKYEVRALDLPSGALTAGAIVDPHERGEDMRGYPLARAISPDGRWAYTLYDGAAGHPFVHALDTSGRTAVCVDLPAGAVGNDIYSMHLRIDGAGRKLTVAGPKRALAVMDTSTFRVTAPPAAQTRAAVHGHGRTFPWLPVGITAAALALGLLVVAGRRAGRSDPLPLESSVARGDVRVVKGDGL
jgi:hypothetical protein